MVHVLEETQNSKMFYGHFVQRKTYRNLDKTQRNNLVSAINHHVIKKHWLQQTPLQTVSRGRWKNKAGNASSQALCCLSTSPKQSLTAN